MPEFPFVQGGVIRTVGATGGASSVATTLPNSGSANVKGAATQLTAATEFDANWVLIQLTNATNLSNHFLVDVLIDASTEQVIIPNLYARPRTAGGSYGSYLFPVFIPKGSRLAGRQQCNSTAATVDIALTLIAGTLLGGGHAPSWVSAYGPSTATSLGVNVDPGGVANTDSAWTQLTASTDRAHNWLVVTGNFGDQTLAAATTWRVSIGIGAATEQVLIPDLHFSGDTTTDAPWNQVVSLPCFVPAGSRLTAKVRSNSTTDGDRDVDLCVYGAG